MGFGRYLRTSRVRLVPWGRRNIMAPSYVLAIDQGTTSTRAILFDKDGQAWSEDGHSADITDSALHVFRNAKRYPRVKPSKCCVVSNLFSKGCLTECPFQRMGMSIYVDMDSHWVNGKEYFVQCHVLGLYPSSTELVSLTKASPHIRLFVQVKAIEQQEFPQKLAFQCDSGM